MDIKFTVHNVSRTEKPAEVEFQGQTVVAMVKCLNVELVSQDPLHGSLTLNFAGDAVDEAEQKFVTDEEVTFTV